MPRKKKIETAAEKEVLPEPSESPGEIQKEKKEEQSLEDVVFDLLSPEKSIDLRVKEVFGTLPESFSIILIIPRNQHELRYIRLLKHFTAQGFDGVYITVNKSTNELLEEMHENGVESNKIVFVDAVTRMIDGEELKGKNFNYTESPDNILELSVEAEHALSSIQSKKVFVIVDSITTLLVYNKDVSVEKFLHTLSQKIREKKFQGIFFAAESTKKEMLDIISQFCDDVKGL
jgi:hypothetical protein